MMNFKEIRTKLGLSQQQIAEITGLSQKSISNYENNQTAPSIETIMKLADYCNVSLDYICQRPRPYEPTNNNKKNTNTITLIGRNGIVEEYILTDEEMSAYQAIFKNSEKYKNNNDGNF